MDIEKFERENCQEIYEISRFNKMGKFPGIGATVYRVESAEVAADFLLHCDRITDEMGTVDFTGRKEALVEYIKEGSGVYRIEKFETEFFGGLVIEGSVEYYHVDKAVVWRKMPFV